MRLIETVIAIQIFLIIGINSFGVIQNSEKWKKSVLDKQKRVASFEFITKSFRNACFGKGFTDLNEWQMVCRDLWKLDYIGWSKAENFMEVKYQENGILFYGTWNDRYGGGEVFQRSNYKNIVEN